MPRRIPTATTPGHDRTTLDQGVVPADDPTPASAPLCTSDAVPDAAPDLTLGAPSGPRLRIEQLPLASLSPWARNARTHSKKQICQIAESIRTFGFTAPVLVDGTGTILAGHGRVEAARILGLEHVPCVRLDHLSLAERRAYVLADNRLALGAGWDEELLGEELAALLADEARGFDIDVTGFSAAEIDTLVDGLALEEDGDPRDDAAPARFEAPRRAEPGDLWQLGPHRLVCGDALDEEVVARLMQSRERLIGPVPAGVSPATGPHAIDGDRLDASDGTQHGGTRELARMVFTDPPYNVPIDGHVLVRPPKARRRSASSRRANDAGGPDAIGPAALDTKVTPDVTVAPDAGIEPAAPSPAGPLPRHREFAMASGEMDRASFTAFLEAAMRQLARHTLDGSIHFICMDWRHMAEMLAASEDVYGAPRNLIVWAKDNGGMGTFYRSRHELIFAFKNGSAPHVNSFELGQHGRYRTNVWEYRGVNTRRAGRSEELAMHPTVKPVRMIADAIRDVSQRGDIVLDLFGGSGSTLIAAHRTGRRARLVEIDPLYCDVILARWEAFAGDEATLLERPPGQAAGECSQPGGQA